MLDDLLFALLPCSQKSTPSLIGQKHSAALLTDTVFGEDGFLIDAGQNETIRKGGAQFFHQIKSQAGTPRARGMQETDIGVQTDAFQCSGTIPGQQGIGEGKECIDRIQRRPPGTVVKGKIFFQASLSQVTPAGIWLSTVTT